MAEHQATQDPFAGLAESDGDDDPTVTDTFVSLDENFQPDSFHHGGSNLNTPHTHSQMSGMVSMDEVEVDDESSSLVKFAGETSAFVWSVGDSPSTFPQGTEPASSPPDDRSYSQPPEPTSSVRSESKGAGMFSSHNRYAHSDDDYDGHVGEDNSTFTPAVIRKQLSSIEALAGAPGKEDTVSSIVDVVTSSTIPNFFKSAQQYDVISNPDANGDKLVLFSRIGRVNQDEVQALSDLANGKKNSLSRIVEMMAYTVEFQTHELFKLKNSDMDIFEKSAGDSQVRWSQVDRRRSFCIRTLLDQLDKKAERISELESHLLYAREQYKTERDLNVEIRAQCEKMDPGIRFEDGVQNAFLRMTEAMQQRTRNSEATVKKQQMELEEYAERLLKLERTLAESQRRTETLRQENTTLKIEIAGHGHNKEDTETNLRTPVIHDTIENHHHVNITMIEQEKALLVEETDELRREVREALDSKRDMEDKLFKNNVELEETVRKMKSLQSQLSEAETNVQLLKESHDHLEEHSRKVAKELSQNTVDAALELDRRELEVRQLRFELEDRESALNTYRTKIHELENQIKLVTSESIARGQAMANGEASSPNMFESSEIKESMSTMQRELNDTRELLNQKYEEVVALKATLEDMDRSIKNAEQECEMWKNSAQSNTRDFESRAEDLFEEQDKQSDTFLRRLSIQLNCHADNKRDLIRKLVERIEELISERVALEEAKEKLSTQIVERQKMIHAISSEYESEISALKLENRQLEQSRDRAVTDRKAVEEKLDELAMINADGEFDDTIDMNSTLNLTIFDRTNPVRQSLKFDDDEMFWEDNTINAAVESVKHLVGNKNDLASRNESLREKLNKLLNNDSGINDDGSAILSAEVLKESREFSQELVTIIGQQQKTISKLRSNNNRRNTMGGRSEAGGEDHSVTFSAHDETTFSASQLLDDDDQQQFATTSPGVSPMIVRRQSKASAFIRSQLEETRAEVIEKMNANTKLSTVIKELEIKLEALLSEKKTSESRFKATNELHDKFVRTLGQMLNVRGSTIHVETSVRELLSTVSSLETKHGEMRAIVKRQTVRIFKFSAQKRVFEHIIGIYQRKYHLNILAPVDSTKRKPRDRFRRAVNCVLATNRMVEFAKSRGDDVKPHEYIDVGKQYRLPAALRIADARFASIPMSSALLALRSNDKLRNHIAEKDKEIADLKRTLATLDVSVPLTDLGNVDFSSAAGFDYSEMVLSRKSAVELRLKKVLQEKEELEVRLSHEKQHRLTSDARAKEYLEKASRLHGKLQTYKATAENRERTYKKAIRYLKSKADSAIDVDFENAEPNRAGGSRSATVTLSGKVRALAAQLQGEEEKLSMMQPRAADAAHKEAYEKQKSYVMGLRKALKRIEKLSRASSRHSTVTGEVSSSARADEASLAPAAAAERQHVGGL